MTLPAGGLQKRLSRPIRLPFCTQECKPGTPEQVEALGWAGPGVPFPNGQDKEGAASSRAWLIAPAGFFDSSHRIWPLAMPPSRKNKKTMAGASKDSLKSKKVDAFLKDFDREGNRRLCRWVSGGTWLLRP